MTALKTIAERDRWIAFVQSQPLPLAVECKPWRKTRSLTSNAYLWAYVYGPLVEVAGFTPEEWHEYFCIGHFGGVPYIRLDDTEGQRPARTTTKNSRGDRDVLKGDEFNEFLMYAESECAKHGVFIEREHAV